MGKWSYNPTYRGYNTIYNWFLDQSCRLLLELGIELDQSWGSLLQFLMLNEVKWVHHVSHPCAIFPQKNKSINFTFNMGNDMIGMYFWNQNEILQPFTTWQPLQQNQKHNGWCLVAKRAFEPSTYGQNFDPNLRQRRWKRASWKFHNQLKGVPSWANICEDFWSLMLQSLLQVVLEWVLGT